MKKEGGCSGLAPHTVGFFRPPSPALCPPHTPCVGVQAAWRLNFRYPIDDSCSAYFVLSTANTRLLSLPLFLSYSSSPRTDLNPKPKTLNPHLRSLPGQAQTRGAAGRGTQRCCMRWRKMARQSAEYTACI
jgi:hypothetical protein